MIAGLSVDKKDDTLMKVYLEMSDRSRRMSFGQMRLVNSDSSCMLLYKYDASNYFKVVWMLVGLMTMSALFLCMIFGYGLTMVLWPILIGLIATAFALEQIVSLFMIWGIHKAGYRGKAKILNYKAISHVLLQ